MQGTDMYLRELEERAQMLMRLQHDKAYIKARLTANVRWDFEMHPKPPHLALVDKLVDDVFARAGKGTPARKGK
jgi:hypothetical protein